MACWPSSAEVVQTSLRPHASASAFQVSFLASLAVTIFSMTSVRVMPGSYTIGRVRTTVLAAIVLLGCGRGGASGSSGAAAAGASGGGGARAGGGSSGGGAAGQTDAHP